MNKMVHGLHPICSIVIAALSLMAVSCTPKGTPIYTLGTPHFVPQSQPDSARENGLSQDPNSGGVFLQWFEIAGASGYKVWRSDTSDASGTPIIFSMIRDVSSSGVLNDTSIVDADSITTGVRYFYYVAAYAPDGSTSNPSDTAHITLIDRSIPRSPGINASVNKDTLSFIWNDNTGGGYTIIRVKDSGSPVTNIWVSGGFSAYGNFEKQFNFDNVAIGELISGHSYQWRVDRFNLNTDQQSKSVWQQFTVN
jgi:hypothetical protein